MSESVRAETTAEQEPQLHLYRIPCRYVGDEHGEDEARAFACGALSVLVGPADYRLPGGDDGRFTLCVYAASPPQPAALRVLRSTCESVLPAVLCEPGARVEIGEPVERI